MDCECALTSK